MPPWTNLLDQAVEIHDRARLEKRLASGRRLRIKLGLDPTAPDIHLGHTVVLSKLRRFQDLGHTAILIIGDFTATIGDPSGRSEARPMLSREQIAKNADTYLEQAFKVLDKDHVEVRRNSEWLSGLSAADLLRLATSTTASQVLAREDFAKRIRQGLGVGLHELFYPVLQGYDSVAIESDLELGGTDQLFNLLMAREIQRWHGQDPQDVAVFPLLEGLDGVSKMSKSLGNYIGVSEPADEIYGKTMSLPDGLIIRYMRLLTSIPAAEIDSFEDQLSKSLRSPRDLKAELAFDLVRSFYDQTAAIAAKARFDAVFRERRRPDQMPELALPSAPLTALELVCTTGLARSRSDARRLMSQNGVRFNDRTLSDPEELLLPGAGDVLQVGRRHFVRFTSVV